MSRKLVFASGLLRCFYCSLDHHAEEARRALQSPSHQVSLLLKYLEDLLALTPLEMVAKACLELKIKDETALKIFRSYDKFLAILDDDEKREALTRDQSHDDLRSSNVWNEVREITKPFHQGLVNLFLNDDADLKYLTMTCGLF